MASFKYLERSETHPPRKIRGCSLWRLLRPRPLPDMGRASAKAQMTAQNEAVRRKVEALEKLVSDVRAQKKAAV